MKVTPEHLREIAFTILKGLKATDEEATLVAEMLVRANMRGIDTHGVNHLKLISDRLEGNAINIPTKLTLAKEDDTTAVVDGGDGLGPVAAHRAMQISIQKARDCGIGLTLVRNTNNIGCLACYTLMAAEQRMIGICACNGAPSVAPWGGAEPYFGTNPISISIPSGSALPVAIDMAVSVVARGKIRRAARLGQDIPRDWALDENGVATTDPEAALKGTLLPIGGPKGPALALAVDILAGMLSGSNYGVDVRTFHQLVGPTGVGAFFMAINIERFMPFKQFGLLMDNYTHSIKKIRKAKGFSRIFLPGEIEFEKEKQSLAEGIEIDHAVADSLNRLLEKVKSPLRLTEE